MSMSEAPVTPRLVVEAVARRKGVPATHLQPLYESIDPEALETLVEHERTEQSPVTVQFEYAGYRVVVSSHGPLVVEPS